MEIKDDLGLSGPLRLVSVTTAERNALAGLSATDSHIVYNVTTAQIEVTYDGGVTWLPFGVPNFYRYSLYSTVNDANATDTEYLEQNNVWDPGDSGVTVLHQTGVAPTIATSGDREVTIPVTGIVSYRVYLNSDDQGESNFMEAKLRVDGSNVCKGWVGGTGITHDSCALEYLGPVTPTTEFAIQWDNPTDSGADIRILDSTLIIQQIA